MSTRASDVLAVELLQREARLQVGGLGNDCCVWMDIKNTFGNVCAGLQGAELLQREALLRCRQGGEVGWAAGGQSAEERAELETFC